MEQPKAPLRIGVGGPVGSGKTALIERIQIEQTIHKYSDRFNLGVVVGDLATDNDAQRLQKVGIPTVQITTGNACHLEANMVANAARQLGYSQFADN